MSFNIQCRFWMIDGNFIGVLFGDGSEMVRDCFAKWHVYRTNPEQRQNKTFKKIKKHHFTVPVKHLQNPFLPLWKLRIYTDFLVE